MTSQPANDQAIYDTIGCNYDETRVADPQIIAAICDLLAPKKDQHGLDIGCGSGNYTTALLARGYQMTGVDVSEEMLNKARKKSSEVNWRKADAKKLPFSDAEFDAAICVLATHHIQELPKACHEIYRVLKPGARFVIFTATPEQMRGYWLCHYFPKMMEDGCQVMSSYPQLTTLLQGAGFSSISNQKFFVTADFKDRSIQSGKHRPEIYLDPTIRKNISTFANTPFKEEVERGVAALTADIENNAIAEIINSHDNQIGDYLLVCAQKT